MWKMLGLLVVGLAAGAAFVLFTRPDSGASSLLVAAADSQNVDVQKSLAALDRRVRELSSEVRALQDSSGKSVVPGEGTRTADGEQRRPGGDRPFGEARTPADIAALRERFQERENERIKAAGLTPERMQAINRRAEELRVAAMQAQYDAQRTGQRVEGGNVELALRNELGDAEYERYLKATGRSTEVRVAEVYATSVAERSGLKAGDEIVSYGGTRVFDVRELNTLTTQGAAGGTVTVEIKRDGQTLQVSVPRGPLGVVSAGGGGRQGGFGGGGPPGGGPGGFRGARPGQ
ncbi:MAG: PDZ domain-containing protein [Steroidobacteraceae bacterium]